MLPNFICPGAQKSGTTTLHNLLSQHPDIFLPKAKDFHFFGSECYSNGINWYQNKYFSEYCGEKAVGDISVINLPDENAPMRIYDEIGHELKLIFILRNPIDRAYSHYNMSRYRGYEKLSFFEAIESIPKRRANLKNVLKEFSHSMDFEYIRNGLYSTQIKRYLSLWPINNMMFIKFEDFIKNYEKYCIEIFSFLGVKTNVEINFDIDTHKTQRVKLSGLNALIYKNYIGKKILKKITNENTRKKFKKVILKYNKKNSFIVPFNMADKKKMYDIFANEIVETEKITGLDLHSWKFSHVG